MTWPTQLYARVCLTLIVCSLTGCTDLSDFKTGERSVFRGTIIGSSGESFIRKGFASGSELEMDFDPQRAQEYAPVVGAISTTGGEFSATELRSISSLMHDMLSDYDMPGGSRLKNFIFSAVPNAGPLEGRPSTVFLSLLPEERVEVRIVYLDNEHEYFGVFPLRKKAR